MGNLKESPHLMVIAVGAAMLPLTKSKRKGFVEKAASARVLSPYFTLAFSGELKKKMAIGTLPMLIYV